jgi:hypothetical protein
MGLKSINNITMKTLREMMDIVEAAQTPVAETFTPNRGQPTTRDELYHYHMQAAKTQKVEPKSYIYNMLQNINQRILTFLE